MYQAPNEPWTRDSALGESTYRAIISVRHELLGGHVNSR